MLFLKTDLLFKTWRVVISYSTFEFQSCKIIQQKMYLFENCV